MRSVDIWFIVLCKYEEAVDEIVNPHRLWWLGHILRMPNHYLPRRSTLAGVNTRLKKVTSDQTRTQHQSMNWLTAGVNTLMNLLPGWKVCAVTSISEILETLREVVYNRLHWYTSAHYLSFQIWAPKTLICTL